MAVLYVEWSSSHLEGAKVIIDVIDALQSAGLVSRTFGIMPEKAFKMQGWIIVGRYMESHFERPTISKWLIAGAAAGAATTIIGEDSTACC